MSETTTNPAPATSGRSQALQRMARFIRELPNVIAELEAVKGKPQDIEDLRQMIGSNVEPMGHLHDYGRRLHDVGWIFQKE